MKAQKAWFQENITFERKSEIRREKLKRKSQYCHAELKNSGEAAEAETPRVEETKLGFCLR